MGKEKHSYTSTEKLCKIKQNVQAQQNWLAPLKHLAKAGICHVIWFLVHL